MFTNNIEDILNQPWSSPMNHQLQAADEAIRQRQRALTERARQALIYEFARQQAKDWEEEEKEKEIFEDRLFRQEFLEKEIKELKRLIKKLRSRLWLVISLIKLLSFDLDLFLALFRLDPGPAVESEIRRVMGLLQMAFTEAYCLEITIGKKEKMLEKLVEMLFKMDAVGAVITQ